MSPPRLRGRSVPKAIIPIVALLALAILLSSTGGRAQDASSPDEQNSGSVLPGGSGNSTSGGDVFSSGSGNNGGGDTNGTGPDEYDSNGGDDTNGGGPDQYNSSGGDDNTPSGYATPPPRFPCGPNALENQAWGGPAASSFLGLLASSVVPACSSAPRHKSKAKLKSKSKPSPTPKPKATPTPKPTPNPACPQSLIVAQVYNQYNAFAPQWYQRGGRTAGGLISIMTALPATSAWTGTQVTETLSLAPGSNTCNIPNLANVCGNGGLPTFTIGLPGSSVSVGIPVANVTLPLNLGSTVYLPNSFIDSHLLFAQGDLLAGVSGLNCSITCRQTYTCGTGPGAVPYGPFDITYSFVHTTFRPTWFGSGVPSGSAITVTRVNATK